MAEGWTSFFYDQIQCPFHTFNNRDFELLSSQDGYIKFHLKPNGICGECYGITTLTGDNDPENFVMLRYDFIVDNADGSACGVTSSVYKPQ